MSLEPSYFSLNTQEWHRRVDEAYQRMQPCHLCPRRCGVARLEGETGVCGVGREAELSSFGPHFGEESPLVGKHGSGTLFMSRCNLKCVFCQNYDISHLGYGSPVLPEQLADVMLKLQERRCHNINIVTPTHVVPQILEALRIAVDAGLRIPLVYNCGGYESLETLKLLDGIVDIYMPDFKYSDALIGERLSGVRNYPEVAKACLKEMHRQVGDLQMDSRGVAYRGLLVRHLILPEDLAGTREVLRFLAKEISPQTYVNIMAQYHPAYQASHHPELRRRITRQEYSHALQIAQEVGLMR